MVWEERRSLSYSVARGIIDSKRLSGKVKKMEKKNRRQTVSGGGTI
jgi:hypothetical protein